MGAAAHGSERPRPADRSSHALGSWVTLVCAATRRREELRLDAIVGTGGMATVYAATARDGRRVALKVLARDVGADPRVRARFFREKEFADRVHHPAAVPIHRAGTLDGGDPVLEMELVDGENLESVRRRLGGKLPLVPALRVAEEVLDFLVACHARDLLHRDIKTSNLLWTKTREVRVVDFGIAYSPLLPGTGADMTLGTPSFMAPEQAAGLEEADARAEVFSVGAVLYTLLLGRRLHRGRTHDESLFLSATQPAPKVAGNEDVDEEVAEVIDRALAFRREDRFPDAASMLERVRALRQRSETRLSVTSLDGRDLDDGLSEGTPIVASGAITVAGRPPDAKGSFAETPLPHLLVHVLARALDGTLVVTHRDVREVVEFAAGAPLRRGASAADDPLVGTLARIAQLPDDASYRFYIDDKTGVAAAARVDPLDAIITSTRRLRTRPPFAARIRATLGRLGDRPLALHPAATPARFGLSPLERAALDAALEYSFTYAQLLEAQVAPPEIVDPMLYALGITRHLASTTSDAWPLGVPRREG